MDEVEVVPIINSNSNNKTPSNDESCNVDGFDDNQKDFKHSEKERESEDLNLNGFNNFKDSAEENVKNSVSSPKEVTDISENFQVSSSSGPGNTKADENGRRSTVILNKATVISTKPLCADYSSDSESESVDSESDSSSVSSSSTTESSSDSEYESSSHDSSAVKNKTEKGERKTKGDPSLADLPPIENLKISLPEDACVEIGIITSIVDTLVVVESFKGTAALDIDTVLFLERGKKTLGKVFDILGPIAEPIYAIRFNNQEEIKDLDIKKDMKVYYAPKTEHTNFVFMSEVLKNRGSDASWKDNTEAPPEFQDFSDDEEERMHRNKQSGDCEGENPNLKAQNKSRKRCFNKAQGNQPPAAGQLNRSRNFNSRFCQQNPNFQSNPSFYQFMTPPPFMRPNFPNPIQIPQFPYNVPVQPSTSALPVSPNFFFPPRLSGPPFPTFGSLGFPNRNQNFHLPFYQQRTHPFGAWGRPTFRPPPPPPPASKDEKSGS